MHTSTPESLAAPHVHGRLAVILFAFTLIAFVVESQLTQVSPARNCYQTALVFTWLFQQYVQTTLGYRQPFFIL